MYSRKVCSSIITVPVKPSSEYHPSHQYHIAVDILKVAAEVQGHSPDQLDGVELPADGVLMHGLHMEAGRFDRQHIRDQS